MQFKQWFFETINFYKKEVIVSKGEILYHGTIESFDARKPKTGGYDDIFWTTDDITVAKMYIPIRGSYQGMSISHILDDKDSEGIRKSLGLNNKIKKFAWEKQQEGFKKLIYWEEKHKEYSNYFNKMKSTGDEYKVSDEFMTNWIEAENNYKKFQKEWKTYEYYLKLFVINKMKSFGYIPKNNTYFEKVFTDKDGMLLKADEFQKGKVLKIICKRDFKFFNIGHNKDGDLMEPEYHKVDEFEKLEKQGYDGIIINDFAQSNYHGNYEHKSIGFFKNSLKDLEIKQIRNQTHPTEKDFNK